MRLTELTRRFWKWLNGFERGSFGSNNSQGDQHRIVKGGFRPQTSTFRPRTIAWGTVRLAGNVIGLFDLQAHAKKQGGKGFGGGATETVYTESILISLCEGTAQGAASGALRVWKGSGASEVLNATAKAQWLFKSGALGQSAFAFLSSLHPGYALGYSGMACVARQNDPLGTATAIPQFSWEVQALRVVGGGILDANPADIMSDIITNQQWGCGLFWQTGWLDTNWMTTVARPYFIANTLFLSPVLEKRTACTEFLDRLSTILNGDWRWSGHAWQWVPYGDKAITANGATFTPDLTPKWNITDDDLLENSLIEVEEKDILDVANRVEIEFLSRANDYDVETIARDMVDLVQNYGVSFDSTSYQYHEICDPLVAQQVAQMRVQRNCTVLRTYKVPVTSRLWLLDPCDIVALNDPRQGIGDGVFRVEYIGSDGGGPYLIPFDTLASIPALGTTIGCQSAFTTITAGSTTTKLYVASTAGFVLGALGGINPRSVRLVRIEEGDKDEAMNLNAEDLGVNSPQSYALQARLPSVGGNRGQNPVDINPPVFMEPPNSLALNRQPGYGEIWIALSGLNQNENWGGAEAFYSEQTPTALGNMNNGSPTLTITSGRVFGWDVGDTIVIAGAGAAGADLTTTILAVVTAGLVFTMAANASTTVVGNAITALQTYVSIGRVTSPATMGTLINPLPISARDPDINLNTLAVDLSICGGSLTGISRADANKHHNLCYVDGEFISFANAAVGANPYQWNLTYLRRHLYTTRNVSHSASTPFVYLNYAGALDQAIFRWPYPLTKVGQTVYFKFCSFNQVNGAELDISTVTSYPITLTGIAHKGGRKNRVADSAKRQVNAHYKLT